MTDNTQLTPEVLAQAVAAIRERFAALTPDLLAKWYVNIPPHAPYAVSEVIENAPADTRLLLQALVAAEARAGRYKAQRDVAMSHANDMADILDLTDAGDDWNTALAILRSAIEAEDANVQPGTSAAAPILYALDYDAYADWYRQTTGRDTPFEPHQLFTIEHNMGKVASEDYVYVHVASVPGCSMPRRFLKAWTPEPDDAAEG